MGDRKYFRKEDLMTLLEKISIKLKNSVHCTLIGGLAMIQHGAKETTKDIDIVFKMKHDIELFIEAIEKLGFVRKTELGEDYIDLKAHSIFVSQEGFVLDLFLDRVLDGFYLTDEMIERSRDIHVKGSLHPTIM